MARYSTALSYIILAVTGLYSLRTLPNYEVYFAKFSFGLILLNSLMGVWRWGNPSYGYKIDKLYTFVSKLQDLLALPCIVSAIWIKYDLSFILAFAHTIIAFLPLVVHYIKKNKLIDYFVGANIFSLLCISLLNENYYGVTTGLSYVLTYYCIQRDLFIHLPLEAPTMDLLNYSMCFFTIFALKAVLDPIL